MFSMVYPNKLNSTSSDFPSSTETKSTHYSSYTSYKTGNEGYGKLNKRVFGSKVLGRSYTNSILKTPIANSILLLISWVAYDLGGIVQGSIPKTTNPYLNITLNFMAFLVSALSYPLACLFGFSLFSVGVLLFVTFATFLVAGWQMTAHHSLNFLFLTLSVASLLGYSVGITALQRTLYPLSRNTRRLRGRVTMVG